MPPHADQEHDLRWNQTSTLASGSCPAGLALTLYGASVIVLCIALYDVIEKAQRLRLASGSFLFVALSIASTLCLLLSDAAVHQLVRAKRASGTLKFNLIELAQIVFLVNAVPLFLFCCIGQFPAIPAVLSQGVKMIRGPLWHVTPDRRVLIVRGEFTKGIADAVLTVARR